MSSRIVLDESERISLQPVLERLAQKAGFPIFLERLIDHWVSFIRDVENGYRDSIYEYTNDLATRALLQRIRTDVSPTLQHKLDVVLDDVDRRFILATEATDLSLTLNEDAPNWLNRIPKKLVGELQKDVEAES